MKFCPKCKITKGKAAFNLHQGYCRDCQHKYQHAIGAVRPYAPVKCLMPFVPPIGRFLYCYNRVTGKLHRDCPVIVTGVKSRYVLTDNHTFDTRYWQVTDYDYSNNLRRSNLCELEK